MAQHFTSTTLIESVKRRALIPSTQSTFKDDDFLAFANEELSLGLLPTILRLHEDYYLYINEIPLTTGTSNYNIPSRSIGNKLRDISFQDNNGNIFEMTRISIADVSQYVGTYTDNNIHAFYVRNNEIVLQPNITGTVNGSLLMSYYLRPNELVSEDKAGIITDIDRTTGIITVSSTPTDFTTNIKYDFIQADSPFVTLGLEVEASSVNSTTNKITFAVGDIPDRLAIGDYINKECETIVPQVPADLHVVLAHRVAARCLEALGDLNGLQAANQKLAEMEDKTGNLIDNRVEDAPKKIVNRHGPLRSGLYRKRWKYRS